MFHVAVLDFFICSHSALVDFQVSGPAQRRTWIPIRKPLENHWEAIRNH